MALSVHNQIAVSGTTPIYQEKSVAPTTAQQSITPDAGYDALSRVNVEAIQTERKNITENGTYTPQSGKFFSSVTVQVSPEVELQDKTTTPSSTSQIITADFGYDGLSSVTVNATPTETKNITTNGTYYPTYGKFFNAVYVNVSPTLQSKSVSPTEESQTVSPDTGYQGLSSVTVNAVSSTYVGSQVPRQAAKTVTPSSSEQIAVNNNTYTTGIIKVSPVPVEEKTITANGTYVPIEGKFFDEVTVAVPSPTLQAKTAGPSTSIQEIVPDQEYYGLSKVTINPMVFQEKSVIPTTSSQVITADSDYHALSRVTVSAITRTESQTPGTNGKTITIGAI